MALQRFKLSLNAATFPLLSSNAARAVCVPALDGAPRQPRTFMGDEANIDYNLPQIIYGENIAPTAGGLRSVGYRQIIAPTVNRDFDSIFALRDAAENTVLYSPSKGKNYIYDDEAGAWSTEDIPTIWGLTPAAGSDPAASRVTYAYVDGKTFVCYSRLKSTTDVDMSIMQWDAATQALIPATSIITNLPFPVGEIDGISSSSGYLLVWSGLSIAWAPFNGTAFDFEIYANGNFTGAGYQIPEDVQGPITAIVNMSGGFIAFTTRNAIAASYYSQAIQAPWVFREIPNAGGLESYEQSTVEGTLGDIYAYTTAGFQRLSINSATSVWPTVSDFVAGRKIEHYRYDLQQLYRGSTTLDFYLKLSNIGNRYIAISYGTFPGIYSYALVYDIGLQRWGKLRMVHRDCFYYAYGTQTGQLTYVAAHDVPYDSPALSTYEDAAEQSNAFVSTPHALAFLRDSGEVVIADWSKQLRATQDEAAAIIGRIQLTRSSFTELNTVEIEGLVSGSAYLQPSYDGRTLSDTVPLIDIGSVGDLAILGSSIDCKNFNIVVHGTFDLSTIVLEATTAGKI